VVLDCGANVGSFARMAAPVVGPKGTVYCLEPMPDVCTALQLNIIKYKEWADQHKLKVAKVEAICAGACRCTPLTAAAMAGHSSKQYGQRWTS
jgi:FkbM family methyltransferase